MNSIVTNAAKIAKTNSAYRVMVVDDSAIIRGFLCRYLSEDPEIDVVTTANNGAVALKLLDQHDIEVVVLDIEMPEMDGMTALPLMMEKKPDLKVVMASTLTLKNAEISLRAMQKGAVDYVPKPETARSVNANIDFRRELVDKVKIWASERRKKRGEALPVADRGSAKSTTTPTFTRPEGRKSSPGFVSVPKKEIKPVAVRSVRTGEDDVAAPTTVPVQKNIQLRTEMKGRPSIMLIGSSTGGPQALIKFFDAFSSAPSVPILITQHMPSTFTSILAKHLGQSTKWQSDEAVDGAPLEPGRIYVAPGGSHMEVAVVDGKKVIRLTDDPPENFCKPAVDPMFRSAAKIYGDKTLAVVLTGMGHDGLKGGREITRVGGAIYAQDEASSVVWGMPGAVATAGLCTEVLPLKELGTKISKLTQGGIS